MQHAKVAIGFSSLYALLFGMRDFGEECFFKYSKSILPWVVSIFPTNYEKYPDPGIFSTNLTPYLAAQDTSIGYSSLDGRCSLTNLVLIYPASWKLNFGRKRARREIQGQ